MDSLHGFSCLHPQVIKQSDSPCTRQINALRVSEHCLILTYPLQTVCAVIPAVTSYSLRGHRSRRKFRKNRTMENSSLSPIVNSLDIVTKTRAAEGSKERQHRVGGLAASTADSTEKTLY